MKPFKKILLLFGVGAAYTLIIYLTFYAVASVYRTNNPALAKKVVILTFFVNICIFAGSWYLVYKLKAPKDKK